MRYRKSVRMVNYCQTFLKECETDDFSRTSDGRGLSDAVIKAFYKACAQKNALAAAHLLRAFEAVYSLDASLETEDRQAVVELITDMRRDLLVATAPSPNCKYTAAQEGAHCI